MADTWGFLGIAAAFGLAALLGRRNRPLLCALLVAVALRAGLALAQAYLMPLPDSDVDAISFESYAWRVAADWHQLPILLREEGLSNLYSVVGAVAYSVFGRSVLLFQSLSVIAGTLAVFLTWRLTRDLWDEATALLAVWIAAIFPTLVLYSALTLREEYLVTCLLAGLVCCVRWTITRRPVQIAWAALALLVGVIFHPVAAVVLIAFVVAIIVGEATRTMRADAGEHRQGSRWLVGLGLLAVVAALAVNPKIPKLGSLRNGFSLDYYRMMLNSRLVAAPGAYPPWMMSVGGWDVVWIIPMRAIYLVFSPFPWEAHSLYHLVGVVDSLLYLVLIVLIVGGLRAIWRNPGARLALFLAVMAIIAYGIGTANFGTAIRHRSTIAPMLIALASPVLLSVVLSLIRRRAARAGGASQPN
jgi:4-amino-4-deoxy-L-arabinose transferase-like glycosyltransferase